MVTDKIYDERAVVLAYVDAQRPAYPHEDFRSFRRARLRALENAYNIRLSHEALGSARQCSLWGLFVSATHSYLGLRGPRDGFLEDSLINMTIAELGQAGIELAETEAALHRHIADSRSACEDLLTRLFVQIWGPISTPVKSSDLRRWGFHDDKEPQLSDYYDEM